MTRQERPGTTLVEVLVAIFVMAIGMLTLLILFPLGALSMAQAIKDDRTRHASDNANAIAKMFNFRQDANVQPAFVGPALATPADPNGSSYAVYVDPIGVTQISAAVVGDTTGNPLFPVTYRPGFFRVNVTSAPGAAPTRWCTLLDDLGFENNGLPAPGSMAAGANTPLARDDRYTFGFLLQLAKSSTTGPVNLTVVVYNGRPRVFAEASYRATFIAPNRISLAVAAGQDRPNIRNGSWVLDHSPYDPTLPPPTLARPQGTFYRVVNVTDIGTSIELELQTNLRTPYANGVVTILEGVTEVFEIGS